MAQHRADEATAARRRRSFFLRHGETPAGPAVVNGD
jgi:hypothetical protein